MMILRNVYNCSVKQIRHGSCKPQLPDKIKCFVAKAKELCHPESVHICDGSCKEKENLVNKLLCNGCLKPLPLYEECYLTRSDPADVARMEGKTFLCTAKERDSIPKPKCGVKGMLGNWMCPEEADKVVGELFCKSMEGRTMYVIPYVMGPLGSPMSKCGVEITDSAYVVLSMRIMTRMGDKAVKQMETADRIIRGLHCCGNPKQPNPEYPWWPCDPKRAHVLHMMERDEIFSYGSGYGGNSLLGKKCFALRFGSKMANEEGWLAEHMLIVGLEPECGGGKRYFCAAFPSACGKTNLAMLTPSIPGYKVTMVGDDIAWMHPNKTTQRMHAINPESGLFGVAPGTSAKSNPNAMTAVFKNSLFTNVAETSEGGVWWEGMEPPCEGVTITDWLGKPWSKDCSKTPAAHPNSRFTTPAFQVPNIDPDFENGNGVPISAFIFGGRRPKGIPLVYQALNWNHGVLVGTGMSSEATSAAEYKAGDMMHDPFAMRPFFGYNFGHYLKHWLEMGKLENMKMPPIFHVNWFLRNDEGGFAWPGYGENIRVLDWIYKRVEGKDGDKIAKKTPIGYIPTEEGINMEGLEPAPDVERLFKFDKKFWEKEVHAIRKYIEEQLPDDVPCEVTKELEAMEKRMEDEE